MADVAPAPRKPRPSLQWSRSSSWSPGPPLAPPVLSRLSLLRSWPPEPSVAPCRLQNKEQVLLQEPDTQPPLPACPPSILGAQVCLRSDPPRPGCSGPPPDASCSPCRIPSVLWVPGRATHSGRSAAFPSPIEFYPSPPGRPGHFAHPVLAASPLTEHLGLDPKFGPGPRRSLCLSELHLPICRVGCETTSCSLGWKNEQKAPMRGECCHLQVLDVWEDHPSGVFTVATRSGREDSALGGGSPRLPSAHGQCRVWAG